LFQAIPKLPSAAVALTRECSARLRRPEARVVVDARLAPHDETAPEWASIEHLCREISELGTAGQACAEIAAFAPAAIATRLSARALECEARLRADLGWRNSWAWRARIFQALPNDETTAEPALRILDEISIDKCDGYAGRIFRHCPIDGLMTRLERGRHSFGRDVFVAAVERFVAGERPDLALQAAAWCEFHGDSLEGLVGVLALSDARRLLQAYPQQPALLECLARHGHAAEAIGIAETLHGLNRVQTILRCCKHAADQQLIGPLERLVAYRSAQNDVILELSRGVPVLCRLPESLRARVSLAILQSISVLPRQQAIPKIYDISPLLASVACADSKAAANVIMRSIMEATRWWPVYPRPSVLDAQKRT
jgi:hypothetical protein